MLKVNISDIPSSPGVYMFIDSKERVIYVGKAKSLKNRLGSYFNSGVKTIKTEKMLSNAASLKTIVTQNEVEALLLEMNLIKTEQPKYNILLKDSKGYPYVKLTNDEFPRIFYTKSIVKDDAFYFGPFVQSGEIREILEYLREAFPLRSCNDIQLKKGKICMKYQIKRCYGPCERLITKEDYSLLVDEIKKFFKGDLNSIKKDIQERMYKASDALQFEMAAFYRDRLNAISKLFVKQQTLLINESLDMDLFYKYYDKVIVGVTQLFLRGGRLLGVKNHFFSPDEDDLLERFIMQFYSNVRQFPDTIFSYGEEISDSMQEALSEIAGKKITIRKRGYAELVKVAAKNAKLAADEFKLKQLASANIIPDLESLVNRSIERIECIDISHLGGENTVGVSIATLLNEFDKSNYRKYKIKNYFNNDVASIKELLERKMENIKDGSEKKADLYVIDGGISQLNVAFDVLKKYNCDSACISISEGVNREGTFDGYGKDEIHIYKRKNPLKFSKNNNVYLFLQKIRDEAHRFAISYSRKLSLNKRSVSALTQVKGVGKTRAALILSSIPDIYTRKGLTAEYISEVTRIPISISHNIVNHILKSS